MMHLCGEGCVKAAANANEKRVPPCSRFLARGWGAALLSFPRRALPNEAIPPPPRSIAGQPLIRMGAALLPACGVAAASPLPAQVAGGCIQARPARRLL